MSMIYSHHHPAFFYDRRLSSTHPFLGLFLKNMFFLATAWFAATIAIRIVVLTLSILFSPPVFVLLLLTFATSWRSFEALRHEQDSSLDTTTSTAFGGRCGQESPCCSGGARQRRREFCRRFQHQCQSQPQQEPSCQKGDKDAKPSSTTEESKSEESASNEERLNKNFQPKRVFYQRRTPFNIEQDDQHVTLSIDVPGYSGSDLNITVDQDGTLTIAGKRKNKIGDAFAFQRQFALSPTTMDTASVTANVVDSLLFIAIAKKAIPKPRLITITTEAQDTEDSDEDGHHVTLSIDVPGYSVNDLSITVVNQDGTLVIAGKRNNRIGDAQTFQRQFVLSPKTVDTASVTANVVDGLLIITIAKKEIPKPRLIAITATTEQAQETDRDETGGPSEEVEEETIVLEKAPVEDDDILLSAKKPIVVEAVNDEVKDDEIEDSDLVEGDHDDSWEDVIKA